MSYVSSSDNLTNLGYHSSSLHLIVTALTSHDVYLDKS